MKKVQKEIIARYELHVSYPLSIKATLNYKTERQFESKILLGTYCYFTVAYTSVESLPDFTAMIYNHSNLDYKVCMNIFIQDQVFLIKEFHVNKVKEVENFYLEISPDLSRKYHDRMEKNSILHSLKNWFFSMKVW